MAATIASNSQEWIASQLSATAVDARPSRTKWVYVQDRNGMMVIEPVVGFYFNPPPDAKCRWSTENGARAPQLITKGLPLPRRNLVLWNDDKLETEAARIREKYWDEMRTLVAPQRFEDLYEYFDSASLFMSGAVNLWNLINLLANDARHNWREVEKHAASECNNWVLDWLEVFPGAASNRESLIKWDMKSDILTAVTSQFDWDNDLKALDLVGQNILRECFLYHFERLTGNKPNVARFNTHAAANKPISAGATMITAAGTVSQASPSPDDAPLPQSSAQPLSTIPEESAAIKTATKPEGLTIDTSLAPEIPLQTVSAPATAVPRITVEPQLTKEAEDVPEKSDRKEKTEDDFLTNQDLADRVQSTARQLSSQSTPGERQDPMLNASTINNPPRAVSATETAGVLQHAHRLQHALSDKAVTIPRNMYGNKPPFQGPPKSPQGYGPNRQQLTANMLTFHGGRSILQQRAPTGPSQQQHVMQTVGPPDNGMQPPPPGFIPPTSTHGISSTPDGFPPPSQRIQLGVGLEPVLGLPGMDFQNQMPMRPPNMGQPQLNHPQAPCMSTPPRYMGQHNIGAPIYQPNGYVPQSQKQPRRDKGDKKKHQDDRRDSMNSTGSRSKIRDDPIHGPVYALKSGKDSNTPTGRQSSNSDGCMTIDSKQSASNSNTECKNNRFVGRMKTPAYEFADCPCFRCVRSSRSLYVKHEKTSMDQSQTALMSYLGGWGAVRVIAYPEGLGSHVVFRSDHDAIRAMQDLCTRPNNGRNIPGMGNVSSLWYAYYSKHYTPPHENPTGLPRGVLEAKGLRRRSSSTLSRGSNAYRNQLPNNILSNTPTPTNYGPGLPPPHFWHGESGGPINLNMVPVYQQLPQRVLWDPDSADQNRKPSRAESKPKNGLEYQLKASPKRPDGIAALKEDWRSKPPAEEVIEDISSDEAAADSSSNVSSQGARGIKVCLPNETGSTRSRSVSPDIEDLPSEQQVQKDSLESKERASQEGDQAERGAHQESNAEVVCKDNGPISSGYRKATAELAVPVEEFQPTVVAEQAQPMGKSSKKGLTSYSKVTSELTEATEKFDVNTVIRHKPPRSPLPEEWMATSEQEPSNLQSRFGALSGALQLEALGQVDGWVAEGTSLAVAPEPPKAEQAPTQKPKAKRNWYKSGKAKKTKSKASHSASASSSSATPTEESRGASQASNNRPASRTSNSRPESAADRITQSPTRSQSATKKSTKSQSKRKQLSTAEPSTAPAGQTKTEGYQDQVRKDSDKASPTKKSKTQHSGPVTETQAHSVSGPVKLGDGTQSEPAAEKHDDCKESRFETSEGGPVCVKEDRSPQRPPQKSDCNDEKESLQKQAPMDLQVAFEPPADKDLNNCSPEANLFPNQKFTIDKVKRDSAMATPPTTKESDVGRRKPSAMHFTTHDARIALPLLPPNSKTSGWASVAARGPRSKSDDPFTTVKGEPQPEDWLRDKAVKTPQKPSSEPTSHQTSPTPSPEKNADHQGGRSRLNAAAKAFEPSSIPASPAVSVVSVFSAAAIPFHTKKPSLPGQKAAVEQRLVTPAEQVVDPTRVTQPGPPTKEKKRVGPAPDRDGDGGQKQRAKSSGTASAGPASKKTATRAASAASIASKLVDEEEFPTLAAAAAVPQRRASSAIKASVPAAGPASKTATATVPKAKAAAAAAPKPPVTSPNNTKLGQRGDISVPAADKQVAGVGEKGKAGEDQWTTVGSGKKASGKKNSNGNNNRPASGKSSGGATGQGGRAGGQGPRSGRAPVGEERKGG